METGLHFVVLLIACLLVSGFFSGLETALTTLSAARTKKLIEEKPLYGRGLSLWLKKPNYVLTTILVGNNISNTLAASMATVLAQKLFQNHAISVATFCVTLVLLVFGEISPKTFARHNSEKLAPLGMILLVPFYMLFLPVTIALSFFASKFVKFVGGRASSYGPLATEEDIAYMIRLGSEEGVLKRGEGQLLQSVIDFRDTVVKESMVPRTEIRSFNVKTPYKEVLKEIIYEGHTRWPVYEDNIDNIIGILHAKDLLHVIEKDDQKNKPFLKNLLRPVKFVPDMMKIGSLLKEFQAGKAHLAVVVDEYGGTAGIISLEDVLEEIVGEIRDEYDDEERERNITQIDSNNYLAYGKASISDVGKVLNISFPESDAFDSLGGFLISTNGRMPKVGEKIYFENCTFLVKAADEKKVIQVHIYQEQNHPHILPKETNASTTQQRAA